MTARLINQTRAGELIAHDVREARSFLARAIGLMGKKSLPEGQTLFFQGTPLFVCNSIHTHFMRFAIDVVFVDKNLKVVSIIRDLKPWRIVWPVKGALSVFEFKAGTVPPTLQVGDVLHVGN